MGEWGTLVYRFDIVDKTKDKSVYRKGIIAKSYKYASHLHLLLMGMQADICLSKEIKRGSVDMDILCKKLNAITDVNSFTSRVDTGYDKSLKVAKELSCGELEEEQINDVIFWDDGRCGLLLIDVMAERADTYSTDPSDITITRKFGCIENIEDVYDYYEDEPKYVNSYIPRDVKTIAKENIIKDYGDETYYEFLEENGLIEYYTKNFSSMSEKEFECFIKTPLKEYVFNSVKTEYNKD